ncbi:3-isopropylmalate/(R)-2-methylmalate dehydratase small subunit [Halolactibacillus halophilus]|uniref:3-isopropylmalate dehydratase small subunit n=1 Tax=Halolactibacillus halophilus TaxID=306540 RepID=A0A1I5N926_9BACI|nr:3-isopropylmalate dehydratase small subunit [Halolactibacillus halophilus]GEM01187.1 3-isopropylmalate dehydratase small subunit [Halolactibacillus halophilus]SFP18122.1 3-isopropylmalate/(R)-2-methylmalate dehydratase small subunit [Halolactibacillus halophilus]
MEPLKMHTGLVYPLNRSNVDTDQIIPKQFLKRISRQGFGQYLFYNWRFDEKDRPREDFSLNDPKYKGTSILVGGENFGCGSSREHAPWALEDYGFRIIIAPSFADIFYNNCTKNGILPVVLTEDEVQTLIDNAEKGDYHLTVDLENKAVTDNHSFKATFDLAEYSRQMLLNGWDEISVTLTYEDKITEFEKEHIVY